jgi:hypothetical protein
MVRERHSSMNYDVEQKACECGCNTLIPLHTAAGGIRRYARSHQPRQRLNLTGARIGALTVVEKSAKKSERHRSASWVCQCDCGNLVTMRSDALYANKEARCPACRKAPQKKRITKVDRFDIAIGGVFTTYRSSAKKRGYAFELTRAECDKLFLSDCHYCGNPPQGNFRTGYKPTEAGLKYNGIDRVDNKLGYVAGNIVACCRFCNVAKHKMSYDDFLTLCRRIAERHPRGSNE